MLPQAQQQHANALEVQRALAARVAALEIVFVEMEHTRQLAQTSRAHDVDGSSGNAGEKGGQSELATLPSTRPPRGEAAGAALDRPACWARSARARAAPAAGEEAPSWTGAEHSAAAVPSREIARRLKADSPDTVFRRPAFRTVPHGCRNGRSHVAAHSSLASRILQWMLTAANGTCSLPHPCVAGRPETHCKRAGRRT